MSYLKQYIQKVPEAKRSEAAIAFLASIDHIQKSFPSVAEKILQELKDQRSFLKLIASENYSSLAVQLTMGNLLTDKYSEGFVGHRFYAGCENVDAIEAIAMEQARQIFHCDHVYVQPHSGADANLLAYWAVLVKKIQTPEVEKLGKKNLDELSPEEYEKIRILLCQQKIMGMALPSGGHLTHGYRLNFSGKMMKSVSYEVHPETGLIDYKVLQDQVKKEKPLILLAGYSAYAGKIDFAKMREIADSVGAVLIVDMAHFAGLVAGKVFTGSFDPVPFAHIVTSTTHKTLRGPRGGMILCQEEFREVIDRGCPLVLGGPLPHVMAAKAVAFKEANTPAFGHYAQQIVRNAKALAKHLVSLGVSVITGDTENHLVLIDVEKSFHLNGRQAESALRFAHLTANRNMIPKDRHGPWYTSGVRVGTPAITTLGMKEEEMKRVGDLIFQVLKHTKTLDPTNRGSFEVEENILTWSRREVKELLKDFPLYPEILLD